MSLNLPTAVAAYFKAANSGNSDSVAQCFAEDAVVHDEGRDMRGRAAILAWNDENQKKYAAVMTPLEATGSASQLSVVAQVAGTFPGSPLPLRFHFVLGDTGISALEITS
ncbi:nuclear transport factor 2 family protein [Collimonas sp. H4R21]|uniref:Nuclear transport factor 2 family protein n=1 Tax=Collimonas rhizosphaerae TaxID=3126357 RepID=A0ABU9PU53_9BURK